MDQGPVVVLRRRAFQFATLPDHHSQQSRPVL